MQEVGEKRVGKSRSREELVQDRGEERRAGG
jgi:hypothetical protein